jgi:uncharacterized protein YunC (DUF1805 family)
MKQLPIQVGNKQAVGYAIALGPVNLVFAATDLGMVACGAFDIAALDKFSYPAAKVTGVSSVDELLAGTVKDANQGARKRGIEPGMTGRRALELL